MERVTEKLGLFGGILGTIYAVGFLVVAGHYRILGLPVRSTDPVPLLGAAWEFVVRGTIIIVLRAIESATVLRIALSVAIVLVLPFALWFVRHRVNRATGPWSFISRYPTAFMLTASLLLVSVQVWHIVEHVIPASAVTSLLFNRGVTSPFVGATRGYLETRWIGVQKDLLGDGTRSSARNLSRRYVMHVVVAIVTSMASFVFWRSAQKRLQRRWVRWAASVPVAVAAFLLAFTPLYYGALLKSYRYPLVNLIAVDGLTDHPDLNAEFADALRYPRFLLETTDDDLYLYDPRTSELHIAKRDQVALIKIITEDFVFRSR